MEKILFVILAIALTATTTFSASATFSWLPNAEADLAGYKIHYGAACGEFTDFVDIGLPATKDGRVYGTVKDIPATETCCAATAYDNAGQESGYSDGVKHDPSPASPADFTKTVIVNVNIN